MKTRILPIIFFLSTGLNASALETPKQVKALSSKISTLNSELTCSKSEDCAALPMGYKACGGPERYLIASKKNPRFEDLKHAIEQHLKADQNWQEKEGFSSICDVTAQPIVECQKTKCAAKAPASL